VAFKSVSKTFVSMRGEDYIAVSDFSLDISEGEFFCLLGPSGCGKTTVLNMLAGFEQPTSGIIELEGQHTSGPSRDRAVIFQGHDSLYPWLTALENVEFGLRVAGVGKKERRKKAQHYLDLVGLAGQGHKHPDELSGGMKQRIQIARVLANEPKMLLMDEPFAALDAQTRSVMQQELLKIWRKTGQSVLFITHDIDEAVTLGMRIGVMTAGPAARLKGVTNVDLGSEQRDRTNETFLRYYTAVYDMIRDEVAASIAQERESQQEK